MKRKRHEDYYPGVGEYFEKLRFTPEEEKDFARLCSEINLNCEQLNKEFNPGNVLQLVEELSPEDFKYFMELLEKSRKLKRAQDDFELWEVNGPFKAINRKIIEFSANFLSRSTRNKIIRALEDKDNLNGNDVSQKIQKAELKKVKKPWRTGESGWLLPGGKFFYKESGA